MPDILQGGQRWVGNRCSDIHGCEWWAGERCLAGVCSDAKGASRCRNVRDCHYWKGEYCYNGICWPGDVLGCYGNNCPRIRPTKLCSYSWHCAWNERCYGGLCYPRYRRSGSDQDQNLFRAYYYISIDNKSNVNKTMKYFMICTVIFILFTITSAKPNTLSFDIIC